MAACKLKLDPIYRETEAGLEELRNRDVKRQALLGRVPKVLSLKP